MSSLLHYLNLLSVAQLWALFLVENLFITASVLVIGRWMMNANKDLQSEMVSNSSRDWLLCAVTNVLNTVVTYAGFWLWQHGFIGINEQLSWTVLVDFVILFFTMDLLMYVFHFGIHKTFYTTPYTACITRP